MCLRMPRSSNYILLCWTGLPEKPLPRLKHNCPCDGFSLVLSRLQIVALTVSWEICHSSWVYEITSIASRNLLLPSSLPSMDLQDVAYIFRWTESLIKVLKKGLKKVTELKKVLKKVMKLKKVLKK